MVNEETETKPQDTNPDELTSSDLITKANDAASRLESANKELARLISIQQKAQVQNTLGGKASAGVKQETEEEKEKAEAKKMLEGTGLEDYAFPPEKK